jgi:hypothetical protein
VFDGRKGEVSPEREGEGYLKPRGRELRAAWQKGKKEKRGPDRSNREHSPGSALRPTDPASLAAADIEKLVPSSLVGFPLSSLISSLISGNR